MILSQTGLQQIVKREGTILHAYKDTVGVWTIGVGHTSAAGAPKVASGMVITQQESDTILKRDLAPIVQSLNNKIKVKVTQNQFDAMVSIAFNVGPKFYTSTCVKKLNAGDVKGAAEAIMMWNIPPEIIGRRRTEQTQFLTPDAHTTVQTGGAVTVIGGIVLALEHNLWWLVPTAAVIVGWAIYEYIQFRKKQNVQQATNVVG